MKPGRKGKGRFVKLEYELIDSPAWAAVNASARSLYIDIKRQWTGFNTNRLTLPVAQRRGVHGGKLLNTKTYSKQIRELEAVGLIDIMELGALKAGGNRAYTVFRLSDRWRFYGNEKYSPPERPEGQWRPGERKKARENLPT